MVAISSAQQVPPIIHLDSLRDKLPKLRQDFGPWVDYVFNEVHPEQHFEAILMGFESIMVNYHRLARESQEILLTEMRQVCQTLIEQRTAAIEKTTEFFQGQIRKLNEQIIRDPLTGLLHYQEFKQRLGSFLAVEQRVRSCAVGVIDLADFKKVNDQGSHELGDRALIAVARQLEDSMRPNDLFARERRRNPRSEDLHARHAGDQFVFMMPNAVSRRVTQKIAERFQRALEAATPKEFVDRFGHPIHADIGVVWYELGPIEDRSGRATALARALFEAADYCMYQGKSRAKLRLSQGRPVSRVYARSVRLDPERNRLFVERTYDRSIETAFALDS
jgi:GGDEF domain-containing protein